MNLKGKIFIIFATKKVSDKFKKREFVLEYAENPLYPQFILFQFTQDKCAILDKYKTGQEVEVEFNLRGREWIAPSGEKKYFNTLEAWKINPVESGQPAAPTPPVVSEEDSLGLDDDLPF